MGEYLRCSKSTANENQYLKEKLLSRYGNSIFVTEGRSGVKNIVTFREKNCDILCEYYNSPREDNEEAQKRAILQTAAKLIKTDMKKAPVIDAEDEEVWKTLKKHYDLCESGWGKGNHRYGIRGDSTSLATFSCERLTLKTWIKMQDLLIYHENWPS